jgi:hypothetical protein
MQKCTYDITFKFLCVFRAKGTYINEDQASSLGDPASQTALVAVFRKTSFRKKNFIQENFKVAGLR